MSKNTAKNLSRRLTVAALLAALAAGGVATADHRPASSQADGIPWCCR